MENTQILAMISTVVSALGGGLAVYFTFKGKISDNSTNLSNRLIDKNVELTEMVSSLISQVTVLTNEVHEQKAIIEKQSATIKKLNSKINSMTGRDPRKKTNKSERII